MGPMVHTKTYVFACFYQQYLVLFTMAPRNAWNLSGLSTNGAAVLVGLSGTAVPIELSSSVHNYETIPTKNNFEALCRLNPMIVLMAWVYNE